MSCWWLSASAEELAEASTCRDCGCHDADIDSGLCYDCFCREHRKSDGREHRKSDGREQEYADQMKTEHDDYLDQLYNDQGKESDD